MKGKNHSYINIPHRLTSGTLTGDAPTRAVNRQMEAALVGTVLSHWLKTMAHTHTHTEKKNKKIKNVRNARVVYILYPWASYWENMGKQSKTWYPALSLSLLHSAGLDPTLPHGGAPMGACALVTSSGSACLYVNVNVWAHPCSLVHNILHAYSFIHCNTHICKHACSKTWASNQCMQTYMQT